MSELTKDSVNALTKETVNAFQYACNKRGVARQVAEWVLIAEGPNGSDEDRNFSQALVRAAIGKLCDMYGIDHDSDVYTVLS